MTKRTKEKFSIAAIKWHVSGWHQRIFSWKCLWFTSNCKACIYLFILLISAILSADHCNTKSQLYGSIVCWAEKFFVSFAKVLMAHLANPFKKENGKIEATWAGSKVSWKWKCVEIRQLFVRFCCRQCLRHKSESNRKSPNLNFWLTLLNQLYSTTNASIHKHPIKVSTRIIPSTASKTANHQPLKL